MTQVSTMVGDIARSADLDIARPAFVELEKFNAKLAAAMSRPAPDHDAAATSRLAWRKLVADLAVDAKAELETVTVKSEAYIFGPRQGKPTPEYLKSIGEHMPFGALTVGFVGRLDSALTKAIGLIADLNARLDQIEGKKS